VRRKSLLHPAFFNFTRTENPSEHTQHLRTAFSSLHNAGGGLRQLDPADVNGIDKALINAQDFASEIIDILEETRHAETAWDGFTSSKRLTSRESTTLKMAASCGRRSRSASGYSTEFAESRS